MKFHVIKITKHQYLLHLSGGEDSRDLNAYPIDKEHDCIIDFSVIENIHVREHRINSFLLKLCGEKPRAATYLKNLEFSKQFEINNARNIKLALDFVLHSNVHINHKKLDVIDALISTKRNEHTSRKYDTKKLTTLRAITLKRIIGRSHSAPNIIYQDSKTEHQEFVQRPIRYLDSKVDLAKQYYVNPADIGISDSNENILLLTKYIFRLVKFNKISRDVIITPRTESFKSITAGKLYDLYNNLSPEEQDNYENVTALNPVLPKDILDFLNTKYYDDVSTRLAPNI